MEGLIEDEQPINPLLAAPDGSTGGSGAAGPYTDLVTQFQQGRTAAGGDAAAAAAAAAAATAAAGASVPSALQQQPVAAWGGGAGGTTEALAFMANLAGSSGGGATGGDEDADVKRARMNTAAAGSTNALSALGGSGADAAAGGAGRMVEGSNLSQVYEAARRQSARQQQQRQQQQMTMPGGYGDLPVNAYAEQAGMQLQAMQQQQLLQQQQAMYGAQRLTGLQRMGGAYGRPPLGAPSAPTQLTTAGKHGDFLQKFAGRFNSGQGAVHPGAVGGTGSGHGAMAGPYGAYNTAAYGAGAGYGAYAAGGGYGAAAVGGYGAYGASARGAAQQAAFNQPPPDPDADADQLLSKCEEISASLRKALGGSGPAGASAAGDGLGANGSAADASDGLAASAALRLVERGPKLEAACSPLAAHLKPYQLVGINFLLLLYRQQVGGAILADEMGLGKTAQAICFLGLLSEFERDHGPHLVVAPASLLENWERELALWCPRLRVVTYHGAHKEIIRNQLEKWRHDVAAELDKGTIAEPPPGWLRPGDGGTCAEETGSSEDEDDNRYAQEEYGDQPFHDHGYEDLADAASGRGAFDVMLTTYTLFERVGASNSADRAFLKRWRWSQMLLDEAHALKNATSQRSRRLRKLASGCRGRVMLTGTPLQNDLGELHNLLTFLLPTVFANAGEDDAEGDFEEALARAANDPVAEDRLIKRMRSLLGPFVLRRLKSELAEQMVSKSHMLHEVKMTPAQGALYKSAVQKVRDEVYAALQVGREAAKASMSSAQFAGRNARARALNNKYFADGDNGVAPIPLAAPSRKRGRPAKKRPDDDGGGILAGTGLLDVGVTMSGLTGSEGGGTTAGGGESVPGSRAGSEARGDSDGGAATTTGASSGGAAPTGGSDSGAAGSAPGGRRSLVPQSQDEAARMVSKLGSQRIANIFTHLRKICQHPLLVRHHFNDDLVQHIAEVASENKLFGGNCTVPRVLQELSGYNDFQLHNFCMHYPALLAEHLLPPGTLMASGKLVALDALLKDLQGKGSRPLIFSQWTTVLDILEWFLSERGLTYVRLDGSTAVSERLSIVDRFNDPEGGIFAFLLSTRAGGQGLNLTGADTVILHDVDFNPAVDRQAEDRCHRLGQQRPVTVHRMVLANTVDNNIYTIAQRKARLDKEVLEGVTVSTEGGGGRGRGRGRGRGGRGDGPSVNAADGKHMGEILAALLAGGEDEDEEDYEQPAGAEDAPTEPAPAAEAADAGVTEGQ